MAKKNQTRTSRRTSTRDDSKPDPDRRRTELPAQQTNENDVSAPGELETAPGVGVVGSESDISTHKGGPGHEVRGARAAAPGAERAATAYTPATGGTGAPAPGSSGIRATSDPNFTAQRADEEGSPTPEALAEQKASIKNKAARKRKHRQE